MRRVAAFVLGASLLVAGFMSLTTARSLKNGDLKNIKSKNLSQLVELIRDHRAPSLDLVKNAYKEYVHLYDMQRDLADKYEGAMSEADIDELADHKYQLITKILSQKELNEINSTLFALLRADNDDERIENKQALDNKIQVALEALRRATGGKLGSTHK